MIHPDQYQSPLVYGPMPEKLGTRQTFGRKDAEDTYASRMIDIALRLIDRDDYSPLGSIYNWDMWVAEFYRREICLIDTSGTATKADGTVLHR